MLEEVLQRIETAKKENSTELDLSKCDLIELPKELFELPLETLDLSFNRLTDFTPLAQLTKLESLVLIDNQLTDLTPLAQLTKLESLVLVDNQLTNLTPLAQLTKLKSLELSNNQLTDIMPLAQLTKLQSLNLCDNNLTNVTPLAQLTILQSLDLRHNQLTDIRSLSHLIEKGISIHLEHRFDGKEIVVGDNPLTIPPPEIIEQGNAAILDYFQSLDEQGGEPLNEAKLIIVGEPGAGKTTLMETLLDPDYQLSEDTESTLGVEVRTGWQFPHPTITDHTFTANIWDFGGQQIQYMTHQFFLTPSAAYVLVSANDRKETTANFPYWFKIIHLLGEEKGVYSPVLVVLNDKNGQFIQQFDLHFYQQRYPELHIKVCHVDLSKRDENYDAMRKTIQTSLTDLPHVSDDRPARWLPIRTELRKRAQQSDHICFKEYAEICQQYEITTELSQTVFSSYLHRLGNLLHFVNDSTLHDFIILNPQWAVDAVYSVLVDNEIARQQGFFSQNKLFAIWKNYSREERYKLLNLMKQENFEICYELADQSGQYVAPQLLSNRRPFYQWNNLQCLRFRFQYKFMPEGIITRLIVRLNHLIAKDDQQNDLVWRTGVLLEKDGCRAQILEEESQEGLKILDIAKYLTRS
ncbi:MAG: COR domain-containing protein [bacterium]